MIKKTIKRIILSIRNKKILKNIPQMIYSYNHNGKVIRSTRVSNSTVITDSTNLSLGEHVFIGHFNFIESSNGIQISDGVQITNYVSILTHSSHISVRLYGKEYQNNKDLKGYKTGKVTIGEYSFIGPHSTILPGASIGKGSLVKAYSLVKGDYPEFSIIGGNPAKVLGSTKSMDKQYLDESPELYNYYNQWAEEKR